MDNLLILLGLSFYGWIIYVGSGHVMDAYRNKRAEKDATDKGKE